MVMNYEEIGFKCGIEIVVIFRLSVNHMLSVPLGLLVNL